MAVRVSASFPRERATVPAARAFARRILTSEGTSADVADHIVQAAAEACNNAILHARGADFTVTVVIEAARIVVSVSDDGDGFTPPARAAMPAPQSTGRRGLALMEAMVDHVDVVSDGHGTTVTLMQLRDALGGANGAVVTGRARPSLAG